MELAPHKTCKTCPRPITSGSRSGYCKSCCPHRKLSEKEKKDISHRMQGNIIWLGRKHSDSSKIKMSLNNKGTMGMKMSLEYRQKLSKIHKGNLHWNWQGGKTVEQKTIRNSLEYSLWREAVFKRDNYTCQNVECGKRGCYLEADHIKPFAYFPDLRFYVNNGRTLCLDCHSLTPTYKGRARKFLTLK
jgi:hypothetical protein